MVGVLMYTKRFTLAFLVFFSSLPLFSSTDECFSLSHERIQDYQEKVIKELKRNTYIKIGLLTVGAAATSYGVYQLFFPALPIAPIIPSNVAEKETTLSDLSQKLDRFENEFQLYRGTINGQAELLTEVGYNAAPKDWWTWTKGWSKYMGRQYITITLASVISGTLTPFTKYFKMLDTAVDTMIDKVFYDANLNWYVTTHTNLPNLLAELEKHAENFNKPSEVDFSYHRNGLLHTWNLSLNQIESVLGFIAFKSDLLARESESNMQRAKNLADRLENQVNDTALSVQTTMNQGSSAGDLVQKIKELRSVLQDSLHTFATIEVLTQS